MTWKARASAYFLRTTEAIPLVASLAKSALHATGLALFVVVVVAAGGGADVAPEDGTPEEERRAEVRS
jgi:hypothetical protein